ncbi:DnaJ domain-containing protein [Flammeovirga sp. EKP202]|uniref:J domain-containing protein n=1 Tax=Flammeovirga sp. EKP202 TaxID=2770592 RepID=UPI00165F9972|nr:DnaJ domain-containing protein [Flammeovirga sp. EKP202]MBD0400371.1 DnaJ domain-containing protein [Flammeovirga sp. EKP202]
MLVDRFKNILKATINDQIEKNPVFQNLFESDLNEDWKKYYEEIKNDKYQYQKQQQQYQNHSQQQYSSQQTQQKSKEDEYYNALEVKKGDDFATIKKSYRKLVKLYHPDLYAGDPAKQEMAQKVTLQINEAYNYFEKKLKN